jgi:hypothetical protein
MIQMQLKNKNEVSLRGTLFLFIMITENNFVYILELANFVVRYERRRYQ